MVASVTRHRLQRDRCVVRGAVQHAENTSPVEGSAAGAAAAVEKATLREKLPKALDRWLTEDKELGNEATVKAILDQVRKLGTTRGNHSTPDDDDTSKMNEVFLMWQDHQRKGRDEAAEKEKTAKKDKERQELEAEIRREIEAENETAGKGTGKRPRWRPQETPQEKAERAEKREKKRTECAGKKCPFGQSCRFLARGPAHCFYTDHSEEGGVAAIDAAEGHFVFMVDEKCSDSGAGAAAVLWGRQ
jgi:hypothetical protein